MLCPAQKHTSSFLLLIYRIDQISKRLNLSRLQGRTEAIRYSSPDTLLLHRVLVHINIEFYKSQAIESNCTGYAIMVNEKVRTRVNNNIYNTYSKYFNCCSKKNNRWSFRPSFTIIINRSPCDSMINPHDGTRVNSTISIQRHLTTNKNYSIRKKNF